MSFRSFFSSSKESCDMKYWSLFLACYRMSRKVKIFSLQGWQFLSLSSGQFWWWKCGQTVGDWAVSRRIWSPAKFANIFELHLDWIHLWMMQVWWPAELTFWKQLFQKSSQKIEADDEKPSQVLICDLCESQWCGFMPATLFGLCWPQPIKGWLWWCKLYFSDSKSVFVRSGKVYFLAEAWACSLCSLHATAY